MKKKKILIFFAFVFVSVLFCSAKCFFTDQIIVVETKNIVPPKNYKKIDKIYKEEEIMIAEVVPTSHKKTYEVTAYCGCKKCCGKSDGITASGVKAVEGVTVAMDKSIPFGTKIEIDGKTYTVQDRGGAIKGDRIDVYFESHEDASQFGRKTKEVSILKGE